MKKVIPNSKNKFEYVGIITILLGALVLACFRVHDGHEWGDDFAGYICQGLSLIDNTQKETIGIMEIICSKSDPILGPGNYPWGYPLLLAPLLRLFGINFILFKVTNIVFFLVSLFAILKLACVHLPKDVAILFLCLIAFNPVYLARIDVISPHLPFLFFSTISIFFIDKIFRKTDEENKNAYILAGIFSVCSFYTRTNGVILVLAVICVTLFRVLFARIKSRKNSDSRFEIQIPRLKYLLFYFGIFIIGYILYRVLFYESEFDYSTVNSSLQTKDFIQNISDNISAYVKVLGRFLGAENVVVNTIILVIIMSFIVGSIVLIFNDTVLLVYTWGTIAALVIVPYNGGARYLIDIFPIIGIICLKTIIHIKDLYFKHTHSLVNIIICIVMLWISVSMIVNDISYSRDTVTGRNSTNQAATEDAYDMYEYIENKTDSNDVFSFAKPRALYLFTGRKAFSINESNVKEVNVDYVLLSKTKDDFYNALRVQNESKYEHIFSNGTFDLYKNIGNGE